MARLLYIKENHQFESLVVSILGPHFELFSVDYYDDAVDLLCSCDFDAIIIDNSKVDDRLESCKQIKSMLTTFTPIVIVTGMDCFIHYKKIVEFGADDCVNLLTHPKYLHTKLLSLMRIKHVYRPYFDLELSGLKLNYSNHSVTGCNGVVVLKPKEFQILKYLMLHCNYIIPRRQLLTIFWGELNVFSNTVEVHIRRIRNKLSTIIDHECIVTEYGSGYRFIDSK